jgi:hypothetical protein
MWLVPLLLAGCHHVHLGNNKAMSATEVCNECCQQHADACKLDSDHPGYYCPQAQQECITACADNNENEMCVIETNKQFAKTAPKQLAPQASNGPPVAATHKVPEAMRGECDNRGTWNLKIGDTRGHAVGCAGLGDVPRDVSFRIERQKDLYALRDLLPQPHWQDGFAVENHDDVCVVTLTRDNHSELERPKLMTVQLTEKDGNVTGTFHYREEMKQPIDCNLDAQVSGFVEAPAPRNAPPMPIMQTAPAPVAPPTQTGPHIGNGNERTTPGNRPGK